MITRDRRSRSASACFAIARTRAGWGGHQTRGGGGNTRPPPTEEGDEGGHPGPFGLPKETAEPEDHEPLIFPDDLDGRPQYHKPHDDRQYRRKDEFLPRHTRHSRPVKARSANKRVGRVRRTRTAKNRRKTVLGRLIEAYDPQVRSYPYLEV